MKEKFIDAILMFAEKLQSNKYMTAIKYSFSGNMPVIICGALSTLMLNVVVQPSEAGVSLANIPALAWLENLSPIFSSINYATLNFLAIGIVVLLAINLGKQFNHSDIALPVVALASYIVLCGTTVTAEQDGVTFVLDNVLSRQYTNAEGLFAALIVGLLSSRLYIWLVDSKIFEIKLPESVPSNVAGSFIVLFPSIFTILIFSTFGWLFEFLFHLSVHNAISVWIQTPLQGVMTGLPGYILIFVVITFLWLLGIHGTQVMKPVYQPALLIAMAQNNEAILAGQMPTEILNSGFVSCFSVLTGAGITGGLLIAILLFSKREDYRTIAKLSIAPQIFNINEPITFGVPVVLNPILAIPFLLSPIVSAFIGYYLTKIGVAGVIYCQVPWTTPAIISGFLASGGNIGTAFAQLLAIVASVFIYMPFILLTNRQTELEK